MRLTVKQLKNRDPGSGMAVVDRDALPELDASGDGGDDGEGSLEPGLEAGAV